MTPDVELTYTQARLQARHAERLDEDQWRRLHGSRSLAHFLQAARRTGLNRWVADLEPISGEQVETALRREAQGYVEHVARWSPTEWRPAISWTVHVLDTPAPTWAKRWRALWPRMSSSHRHALEELAGLYRTHAKDVVEAGVDDDSWRRRQGLRTRLSRLFRRHPAQPVATFCHLALVGLDLERLRGAILRRLLFPDVRSTVAWV